MLHLKDATLAWLFVIVQFALLAAIVLLPRSDAWPVPGSIAVVALVIEFVGAAVLVIGIVNLGRSLTPLPTPVAHGELRTGGFYRWVRHPIYAGIMALTVGLAIRSSSVAVAVATAALIAWFMVKARWEESRLEARYPAYVAYAARTPRFVPFWGRWLVGRLGR
jgi:protein-S-isoprenylcysteine O-methyltransferase Ste14